MRRRWWRRLAGGLAAFAVLEVGLVLLETDPDPVRLALLVATCVALLGLTYDALGAGEPAWELEIERPSVRDAGDARLGWYVTLLEAHVSARSGDRAVRDRLGALADQVLRQRHGLSRDDPGADALLGPQLTGVLRGPPRRMTPTEIDHCLTTIEEL